MDAHAAVAGHRPRGRRAHRVRESSVARSGDEPIRIVAAENFWGDIAAQLGGRYVAVTSIISDPTADPHLYESDARTAAAIEGANFDIWNGQGYDDFFTDVLDSSMRVGGHSLRVDRVLRVTGDDANPHLWYDVPRVGEVARAIVDVLGQEDPAHKAAFAANLAAFRTVPLRPVLDAPTRSRRDIAAPPSRTERGRLPARRRRSLGGHLPALPGRSRRATKPREIQRR